MNSQNDIKDVLIIGDSFSVKKEERFGWLDLLEQKYNWNVVNKSWYGVGPSYNIIKFLEHDKDFDLCIFVWSEASRYLFHKDVRDLNMGTARDKSMRGADMYDHIYDAAKNVFDNLTFFPMVDIQNLGLLKGFDSHINKHYKNKLFWHFYAFPSNYYNSESGIKLQSIPYKFKTGVTMYPSLFYYSNIDPNKPKTLKNDWRHGHLSPDMHLVVYEKMKNFYDKNIKEGLYLLEDINIEDVNIGIKI